MRGQASMLTGFTVNYREAYGMHASNGILFNHESPLRGETFRDPQDHAGGCGDFPRKQDKLYLGQPRCKRDWGHAKEYVQGMWLMMQQDEADDYRAGDRRDDFGARFRAVGVPRTSAIPLEFRGEGIDRERLQHHRTGVAWFRSIRPTSAPPIVDLLLGDPSEGATRNSVGSMKPAVRDSGAPKWSS